MDRTSETDQAQSPDLLVVLLEACKGSSDLSDAQVDALVDTQDTLAAKKILLVGLKMHGLITAYQLQLMFQRRPDIKSA